MRYWLLGKGFHVTLEALEYASHIHTVVRKDGTTREYAHELVIGRNGRSPTAGVLQIYEVGRRWRQAQGDQAHKASAAHVRDLNRP